MRVWLYNQLMTLSPPGGVFENTALHTTPKTKPFVVYSMGTLTPEMQDANLSLAMSLMATIWVHGTPGDYQAIDQLLKDIRVMLERSNNSQGFIAARYLSSSDDLRDPEMGTIMRYSRYQLIHTP